MPRNAIFFVGLLAVCLLLLHQGQICQAKTIAKRASSASSDVYTTKYDNIDVGRIVSSRRLLLNYINCLLDKGPCTPEGRELKLHLPEALETECAKCSKKQKEITGTVLAYMVQNYKDLWDALLKKYDPEGTFRKKYEGGGDEEEDYEEED